MRHFSLAAAIIIASAAAPAHIRAQDTPIPSGRLVFRLSSLEFRPDATFLIHTVLEGIGAVRATGTWKSQSGAIELAAHNVAADGKIYLGNEDGAIAVVAAERTFRHIATNEMGEPIMATPALSRGVLFVRTMNGVFAIGRKR